MNMNKADKFNPLAPTDLGSAEPVAAKYTRPVMSLYRGNPLIEALPPLPEIKELARVLSFKPEYDAKADLAASAQDRLEMLEGLRFLFQSLPRHLNLAQGIFSMVRAGYVTRNPKWGRNTAIGTEGALDSAALVGASGAGKTQSIRRVLRLIPQVIAHTEYNGTVVSDTQVAWLQVECPHDASPRGLCSAIFEKIDELLGTSYTKEYGGSRSTTNSMIPGVRTLVRVHHLGLLVIDEVQNLFKRKTSASAELEDFIVRIVNDLKVPVLMIGTYETAARLMKDFRVTRRMTGLAQPNWGRLVEGDLEWKLFTNTLWRYRYVLKDTPLTPELRHFLFELTQGIPDLAVKLYFLAQRRAINEETEQVTPELLQKVTDESLVQNKKYLRDLKDGMPTSDEYVSPIVFKQEDLAGMPPSKQKAEKRERSPKIDTDVQNFSVPPGESSMDAAADAGYLFSEDDSEDSKNTEDKPST